MTGPVLRLVSRLWKCWQCQNEVPNSLKKCPTCG